jgi:hypothetical protein
LRRKTRLLKICGISTRLLIGAVIQSAAVREGKHNWLKEQWLFESPHEILPNNAIVKYWLSFLRNDRPSKQGTSED